MKNVYKFNKTASDQSEDMLKVQYDKYVSEYSNPKSSVWNKFHCSISSVLRNGFVACGGYMFDLTQILNQYLVMDDGKIHKMYCINKTILRNACCWTNKKKLKIADCPNHFKD